MLRGPSVRPAQLNYGQAGPSAAAPAGPLDVALWALFLLLLSIQDLAKPQDAFGRLAGIPCLLVVPVLTFRGRKHWRSLPPTTRRLGKAVLVWLVAYTAASLLLVPFLDAEAYGSSPLGRCVKLIVVLTMWLLTAMAGSLMWQSGLVFRLRWIIAAVLLGNVALLVLTVGGAAGGLGGNEASFWHGGFNTQQRPRLLTLESSNAGALLMCLACLLSLVAGRNALLWLVTVAGIAIAPLTLSRGATAVVPLALAAGLVSWLVRRAGLGPRLWSAGLILAMFAVAYFGATFITLRTSQATSSSDATRSAYARAAVIGLGDHPLGATFSNSLNAGHVWLSQAALEMRDKYPASSLTEVSRLLTDEKADAFSPKSLPSFLVFQSGFVGLVLFLYLVYALGSAAYAQGSLVRLLAMFIVILSSATYIDTLYSPEIPLLAGLLLACRPEANQRSASGTE